MMLLNLEPLTAEDFAPFGQVLEVRPAESKLINHDLTRKFGPLAEYLPNAQALEQVFLYRSQPITLPFALLEMERHTGSGQTFFPLQDHPFPVVVSNANAAPGPHELRAFLSNGRQGIHIARNTWHHHQLSLAVASDYLVVESSSNVQQTEVIRLPDGIQLTDGQGLFAA